MNQMTSTTNSIRQACARGSRAVILVPEACYEDSLKALACRFAEHAGRTARMPGGELLTVLTPQTPVGEIQGGFDLYLSGWGKSTPRDEREVPKWVSGARGVYAEIS